MRRLASSTRSWKRRSSKLGAGSMSGALLVVGNHIEREHQVAGVVGAADRVGNVDVQHAVFRVVDTHRDGAQLDARLPAIQAYPHRIGDVTGGGGVGGGEDIVVDSAAEFRSHRPLPGGGGQDEPDTFFDLALVRNQGDAPGAVGAYREGPS